jgi:hypothetical protein
VFNEPDLLSDRRSGKPLVGKSVVMVPAAPAPAGAVLVHNHQRHTARTISGTNRFRVWWDDPDPRYVVCDCGWRPELGVHHALGAAHRLDARR